MIPPPVFTLSELLSVLKKYLHSSRWIAYRPESDKTALKTFGARVGLIKKRLNKAIKTLLFIILVILQRERDDRKNSPSREINCHDEQDWDHPL